MLATVNRNPSTAELHKFGWGAAIGFGVVGALLWYTAPDPNAFTWVGATTQKLAIVWWTLGFGMLAGAYCPRVLAVPVYVGWMTVAMLLGTLITGVVLTVLFIVLLPPFSLIRLSDPLRLKLKSSGESYWEDHQHHESTLERTARPF